MNSRTNRRLKKSILALLLVGQLGLLGCATPQARLSSPAPTPTLSVSGLRTTLAQAGTWTGTSRSGVQPVCMQIGGLDGVYTIAFVLIGVGIVSFPIWAPLYLLDKLLGSR